MANLPDLSTINLRIPPTNKEVIYRLAEQTIKGLLINYPEYRRELEGDWIIYGRGDNLYYLQSLANDYVNENGFLVKEKLLNFDLKHYEFIK